jgi:hypothetical protein
MASAIVDLASMKAHLRYPNPASPSSDDTAIQGFIDAAEECIRFECDDVIPTLYSERHDGGDFKIYTHHRPLLEVKNIEEGWGWITYELDYQDPNTAPSDTTMFGYSVNNYETGEIARRSVASVPLPFIPGERNIYIQYTAGYAQAPANIVLATKELVAHWWQNSQLRALTMAGSNIAYDTVTGAAYTRDTETGVQNINVGVPYRILELIKAHRKMPIIA